MVAKRRRSGATWFILASLRRRTEWSLAGAWQGRRAAGRYGAVIRSRISRKRGENLVGRVALAGHFERDLHSRVQRQDQAIDHQPDGGRGAVAGQDRRGSGADGDDAERAAFEI